MKSNHVALAIVVHCMTIRCTTSDTIYSEDFETSSCSVSSGDLQCEFGRRLWSSAGSGDVRLEANPGFPGGGQLVLARSKQVTLDTAISTVGFENVAIEITVLTSRLFGNERCEASYRIGNGAFDLISNIDTATMNLIFPSLTTFKESNSLLDGRSDITVRLEQFGDGNDATKSCTFDKLILSGDRLPTFPPTSAAPSTNPTPSPTSSPSLFPTANPIRPTERPTSAEDEGPDILLIVGPAVGGVFALSAVAAFAIRRRRKQGRPESVESMKIETPLTENRVNNPLYGGSAGVGFSAQQGGSNLQQGAKAEVPRVANRESLKGAVIPNFSQQQTQTQEGEATGTTMVVLEDFVAEFPDELTVKKGTVVVVKSRISPEWVFAYDPASGNGGIVPLNFLE